jgi:alpha-glucosidase
MRVDAVKYLYENEASGANMDQPETLEFFRHLRADILDRYGEAGSAKMMVAENWTGDATSLRAYLGPSAAPAFQATLDFPFGTGVSTLIKGGSAASLAGEYSSLVQGVETSGGWTFTFLNNHDNYLSRPMTEYGSVQKVRLAQTLQMAGWGTPVLYYGNEIGMTGVIGSDSNLRTNFDWTAVAAAQANPDSLWSWQKTLDGLRQSRASLRRGEFRIVKQDGGVFAWVRSVPGESTLAVINLTAAPIVSVALDLTGAGVGSAVSTLVGDGDPSLVGTTLTVLGLPACVLGI